MSKQNEVRRSDLGIFLFFPQVTFSSPSLKAERERESLKSITCVHTVCVPSNFDLSQEKDISGERILVSCFLTHIHQETKQGNLSE